MPLIRALRCGLTWILFFVLTKCFQFYGIGKGMKNQQSRVASVADYAASTALYALGVLHIVVIAVTMMLILIAQGRAEEQANGPSCGGKNLLTEMALTDPEALEEIEAEAAKVPFGQNLLFKLEKAGREPSYLFGTMHMTDPRVVDMPAKAQQAFENSDIVAIESTEILDPAQAQITLISKPELTMFLGDDRLSNYLDDDSRKVLADGLAERGLQLALIDRMKPWLLSGMLALPECEFTRKQAGAPFLDLALAQNAEAQGKTLVGLETLIEQFDALASLPMEFHVQGLVDTLALGDQVDDVLETMIVLYTEGKTGTVWPMLRAMSAQLGDSTPDAGAGYVKFEETMVNTRNLNMFERSLPLVEQGNAFIAVGALHLPGEKGLAQLYQSAGYTVTPLK